MGPSPLQPATAGRTLVVDAAGLADANAVKVGPTGSGTAQTTGDLKASLNTIDDFIDTEVAAIITTLGTPAGASVSADIAAIEAQTDDIGAAGAGLTAVPWNAAWDAEVQSEVDDALVVQRLDELLAADSDIDGAAPPTVGSVFHELMSKTAGSFTFDQTTDSNEAIRDNMGTAQTGDSFARLGAPAGASVSADILAVDNLVDDLESRLGTPSDLGSGATVAANLVDIEGQTDDIGAAGAGLTAVPWNAAWDAEVQSEVDDALVVQRLDELVNADSDIDGVAPPTVGSVFHELLTKTPGSFTYDQTTDSLEALKDGASAPTVGQIADAVWDETLSGHLGVGSTGEALNAAGSAGDPWVTVLPGAYGAGSAGKIVGDNINATISSRSSHSAADVWATATRLLTAGTNIVLAKGVGVTGFNDLSAAQVNTEADTALTDYDGPTNAELATALGTADDAVLAAVAALNNLSQANVRTAVGLASANLDTQLGDLPTNAELATALGTADDAVLAAIAALNNLAAGAAMTLTSGERTAIANALLDLADTIEVGLTLRNAQRLQSSAAAGKLSGAATTTAVLRNAVADSKDRITATVDADGNRSAVTLDLT
jgi:hypothetical protein